METLSAFWQWAEITPEEYAQNGMNQRLGKEEFDYPYYDNLINHAKELINQSIISNDDMDDFLTIMALDNESEHLLDYSTNSISLIRAKEIVERGMRHMQPHARWQIAELAYRVRIDGYLHCLKYLSNDLNEYVKRRARNCLRYLEEYNL